MSCDTVIVSGNVFTGEDSLARPLAIGIKGERIAAVVDAGQADSLVGPTTTLYNLGDAFVCAGFHDAHQHVLHAALFPSELGCEYVGTSEADAVAHMRAFAEAHPGDGWLLSHGWRANLWDPPEFPSRASLDEAFPTRPVCMYSGDSHTMWTNMAGLAALGILDEDPSALGHNYERDSVGKLTGVIHESAGMFQVGRVLEALPQHDVVDVYRSYLHKLSSLGITSLCDMAVTVVPGADAIRPEIYRELLAADELGCRVHLFPTLGEDESNLEDLQAELTGTMLRAPGFKQFFDGVSSQHTAWVGEPYTNAYYPGDTGHPSIDPERMRSLILSAASRGHAVRIHTIGDEAVHQAALYLAEAHMRYGEPTQGRHTLEHVEDIRPEDLAVLRDSGIVVSVQPVHVVLDITQPDRDLGPERALRMWPFRTFEELGIPLAFGSDVPCATADSRSIVFCATTRQTPSTHEPKGGWHPEQRISRAAAIRAYTRGSAWCVRREDELGLLATGQLADLVVWDRDLLNCADEELEDARPLLTLVGGRAVYEG